jgi:hypothetical protein
MTRWHSILDQILFVSIEFKGIFCQLVENKRIYNQELNIEKALMWIVVRPWTQCHGNLQWLRLHTNSFASSMVKISLNLKADLQLNSPIQSLMIWGILPLANLGNYSAILMIYS